MKNFIQKYHVYFILFIIVLIGFLIRIWSIDKNPAGFFCDEASIGYNAFSILKTGKDEWGVKFPLFFKAFGEYKNPLDIYSTIIPVFLFGLNEFSVRFTSVVFSLLSGIVFFFVGKKIINKYFGLVLSSIYLFLPWSIHLSRINMEGFNILFFLILMSILFLIYYQKNQKIFYLNLFYIFLGISTYSYFPARIIAPISALFISIIIFLKSKNKLTVIYSSILYLIILVPLLIHLFGGNGLSRWKDVSLWNQTHINPINKITKSYLLHFSPDYLFIKGDIDMDGQFITRHSIKGIGQLFSWQATFLIIGLYILLAKINNLYNVFFLILLILYPIPSSITNEISPQATRSLIGVIPFVYLISLGLWKIVSFKKIFIRNTSILLILFIGILSQVNFLNLYNAYPQYSSDYWGWQFGPREIMAYFKTQTKNYDELYMTGSFNAPEIFLKFYDPERKCQNCFIGGVDKYDFAKKQLFAIRSEELKDFKIKNKIKKIIYYPNGKDAFYIL